METETGFVHADLNTSVFRKRFAVIIEVHGLLIGGSGRINYFRDVLSITDDFRKNVDTFRLKELNFDYGIRTGIFLYFNYVYSNNEFLFRGKSL